MINATAAIPTEALTQAQVISDRLTLGGHLEPPHIFLKYCIGIFIKGNDTCITCKEDIYPFIY
ncbi:MAG: hypothetical protein A2Z15_08435 [Chloroflexi bacterium RBG_16_50_11]|nr:MAG: hypothetical protein A2Z15_08435 [Chloroflexi bacterium RBG_16_50_11]